ncbi:MAG: hypothetical protein JXR48_13290 [Candidatus Delongbacteria bacterium]|nr:hypothetical protein [Candidatus Delongbacteria bacterium]MBN2835929.1 hypothetical protein [Candidatus Delongbacteria bacterium]
MFKKHLVALAMVVSACGFGLLAEDCSKIENEVKAFEAKFKQITADMGDKSITKDKYEALKQEYAKVWKQLSSKKAELKKCEEKANQKHKFHYNNAMKLKKDEDYKGAVEELKLALKESPDFTEAMEKLAEYSAKLKDEATVMAYVPKINDESKAKALYILAKELKANDTQKAIKYYIEAAKYGRQADSYYWVGALYYTKLTDYNNAISYFEKSLKFEKDAKVYELLGACYMEMKPDKPADKTVNIEKAISYFEKGEAFGPTKNKEYYMLCLRLSQAYNELGKSASALEMAIKSIQNNSNKNYGPAHLEKGKALFRMKKYKEAKESLTIAKEDALVSQNADYWLKEIEKVK